MISADQHRVLRQILISYGWGQVYVHAFIVGHTGVMSQANADILQDLGVSFPDIDSMLTNLAVSSLQKSCAILSCFPKVSRCPDTACDDGRSTPGRDPTGSAGLQATLTPHSAGGVSESRATLFEGRGGSTPNGLGVTAHPPPGGGQSAGAARPTQDIHLAPPPHQISPIPAEQLLPSNPGYHDTRIRAISMPGSQSSNLQSESLSSRPNKRYRLAQAGPVIMVENFVLHLRPRASIQTIVHRAPVPGALQIPSSVQSASTSDAMLELPQASVRRAFDPGG